MSMAQLGNSSRFAPAPNISNSAAAAAQKAQEIAAKLSMTLTGKSSSGVAQQHSYPVLGGSSSVTIDIPVEKVGLVIGKAGSMIREIQQSSGARLQLDSTGEPTRVLRISGFGQSVEMAKARIEGLINQPTFQSRSWKPTKSLQIPCECVGFVIGKGGETIKRISQETGCRMQIEDEEEAKRLGHALPTPGHQNLHLIGNNEAVSNAEAQVRDLLQRKQGFGGGGGLSYNAYQQPVSQLRAQPYPAYIPQQGYAQLAQQAYPASTQMYPPNQMQGYGAYTPQYAAYPPQPAEVQPATGYPPSYPPATPQTYSTYPSQTQQSATLGQYPAQQQNLQPTPTYQQNPQQTPAEVNPYGQSGIQNAQHTNPGNMGHNLQQTAGAGMVQNPQETSASPTQLSNPQMSPNMLSGAGMPNINQYGQIGLQSHPGQSPQVNQTPNMNQAPHAGAHQYQQPRAGN